MSWWREFVKFCSAPWPDISLVLPVQPKSLPVQPEPLPPAGPAGVAAHPAWAAAGPV